jgi:hypothetical protein
LTREWNIDLIIAHLGSEWAIKLVELEVESRMDYFPKVEEEGVI